jgi:hypothetical protein
LDGVQSGVSLESSAVSVQGVLGGKQKLLNRFGRGAANIDEHADNSAVLSSSVVKSAIVAKFAPPVPSRVVISAGTRGGAESPT